MTNATARFERRLRRAEEERRQRANTALAFAALLITILLFGIAGTLDYEDRTEGLGASMLPSVGWCE